MRLVTETTRVAGSVLVVVTLACARDTRSSWAGFVDSPVAAVVSQVSGQVASVEVREGERVKRGQLLARLDARERAAVAAQADAGLLHARQAFREAERNAAAVAPTEVGAAADIARQQAELDDAEAEYRRTKQLTGSGFATPSQLDSARSRVQQAVAAVASLSATRRVAGGRVATALASVETARAALRIAEAQLELARVQLAEAEIRSPFDGLVVEQDLQAGEWAAPGTPVVTVEDVSRRWVRIDVEETQLGAIRLGAPARIRVVAFPGRTFDGRVLEVGAQGEFAINRDVKRGRPDVRTFRVRVAFERAADELRPGMTAEVVLGAAAP